MHNALQPDDLGPAIIAYHPSLLAFVRRRVSNPTIAEDLTADAEEHAWRAGLPSGITHSGFEAWMRTIARNIVYDYYRYSRSHISLQFDTDSIQGQLTWAHDAIDDQIMMRIGLAALAPYDRRLIQGYLAGYTARDLAAALGVQAPAVRTALKRGFQRLRTQLQSRQPIHHTAYGDAFGIGIVLDSALASAFERTAGVQVNVIAKPASATDAFAMMQHAFRVRDDQIAIYTTDVVWNNAFARHLVSLDKDFSIHPHDYAANILQPTYKGQHVAVPLQSDFGMLYYRTDLLQRYGYTAPPSTWSELEVMALTIMAGEHARGNRTLTGYIWQAAPYEGLVCTALEVLASQGGGTIIDNGVITVNNPAAIEALKRAQRWIGTISPQAVLRWTEEDTRLLFQRGDAIFMRNWPYAYRLLKADPMLADVFAVAPLPHAPGLPSVGTIGGAQLSVSRYAKERDTALAFVDYVTSPQAQKLRALVGSYIPTLESVRRDPEVRRAIPHLAAFDDVQLIARPSAESGSRYNRVSAVIFQHVHHILRGANAAQTVAQLARDIQRILAARSPL